MEELSESMKDSTDKRQPAGANYTSPYFDLAIQKSSEIGPNDDVFPYTIGAVMHGQNVEFNGMNHVNNPADASLNRVEQRLNNFIQMSTKPIVFVEGGMRDVAGLDRDSAIQTCGEPGLITKVALDAGVEVQSPEPPIEEEVSELLKFFSPNQIMQYYFSRQLFQWYRNKDQDSEMGSAQEYIDKKMQRYSAVPGLELAPKDYDTLAGIFAEKFGFKPEEMPEEHAKKILHDESSPFNPVSAASGDIRDRYIFKQISNAAAEGRDVFIVYGSYHSFVFEQMVADIKKAP
jgi:hypothetical protein